jgi:glycosyltransferase involved in cell wall biosynthesis
MDERIDVSAIVPIGSRYDASGKLVEEYLDALSVCGKSFEVICVLDGAHDDLAANLLELCNRRNGLRVFRLSKPFGEATALAAGIEQSSGAEILTLPGYYQVDPSEIGKFVKGFEGCDMAIAVRWPRAVASRFEAFRRNTFHRIVQLLAREDFRDLGCGVRLMKRNVIEEIALYGEQHRFLAILASRQGFNVREVELRQSEKDRFHGRYGPRIYLRRLLDIATVFFLTRFMKKPLRLFGMVGGVTSVIGALFLTYVVIERLFFGVDLADRPALFLSSLLVVLGLQLFALGLLGELIIFAHARDIKEYAIERVVN